MKSVWIKYALIKNTKYFINYKLIVVLKILAYKNWQIKRKRDYVLDCDDWFLEKYKHCT